MNTGTQDDLAPLDGNAVAGLLSDFFVVDMTTAVLTCDQCGASAELGAIHVYGGAMGAILRCLHCDNAVLRLVQTPRGSTLDLRGARRLVVGGGAALVV